MATHDVTYEVAWHCSCGMSGGPCDSEAHAETEYHNHLHTVDDEGEDTHGRRNE
jgi:hypothetical protein